VTPRLPSSENTPRGSARQALPRRRAASAGFRSRKTAAEAVLRTQFARRRRRAPLVPRNTLRDVQQARI
jgi:hypothetical protein